MCQWFKKGVLKNELKRSSAVIPTYFSSQGHQAVLTFHDLLEPFKNSMKISVKYLHQVHKAISLHFRHILHSACVIST